MNFGVEHINVFYHYKYDINTITKMKKRMLLKEIDTFYSSSFLCELMIDYPIDFIIHCSQHDIEFMAKNYDYIIELFGIEYHGKMHNAHVADKRLKNLKIRSLLIEKLC